MPQPVACTGLGWFQEIKEVDRYRVFFCYDNAASAGMTEVVTGGCSRLFALFEKSLDDEEAQDAPSDTQADMQGPEPGWMRGEDSNDGTASADSTTLGDDDSDDELETRQLRAARTCLLI